MTTTTRTSSWARKLAILASAGVVLALSGCAQYSFETPQGPAYAYGPLPAPQPVYPVAPPPVYEVPHYAAPRYVRPDEDYGYARPAPRVYEAPSQPCGPGLTPNRVIGGIAGGLLGSMIGRGNGRIASSAAGAIIGSSMGGC